jgi:P-type Ca2+ transporter type 2C
VGEGRIVQDNLRRSARYLFATNLSEVGLVLAASLLGLEALSPIQLLWVNILTDTLPALAIAFEPGEPRILDRPPAPPEQPIIGPGERRRVLRDGLLLAGLGGLALAAGGPAAAFAALPAAQLTYAVACRAQGSPRGGAFAALVGGGAALHLAAVLWPPLRAALRAAPPTPVSLVAYVVGLAAPVVATLLRSDEIVVRGPAHPEHFTGGPDLEGA